VSLANLLVHTCKPLQDTTPVCKSSLTHISHISISKCPREASRSFVLKTKFSSHTHKSTAQAPQICLLAANPLKKRRKCSKVPHQLGESAAQAPQICFCATNMLMGATNAQKCYLSSLRRRVSAPKCFKAAVRNCCSEMLVSVMHKSVVLHSALHYSVHVYARLRTSIQIYQQIYIYIYIYIMEDRYINI